MTAPANDDFADAVVLSGALPITLTGETNVDATTEVDEPTLISYGAIDPADEYDGIGASIWYAWTCGTAGTYSLNIDTDFDSVLTVYTGGTAFGDLERLDQSEWVWDTPYYETVYFAGSVSQTYYFQIGGYDGATGDIDLELDAYTPPANDDFADAEELTGTSDTASGSNVGAGLQSGEPRGVTDTIYHAASKSVWYEWTAPSTRSVTLSLTRSGRWSTDDYSRTTLGVYTGTAVGSLTAVVASAARSSLKFLATSGTTYRIQVGGDSSNSMPEGSFTLSLTSNTSDNDYFVFATPLVLSGGSAVIAGDGTNATMEDGEPDTFQWVNLNDDPPVEETAAITRSLWWSWQAPAAAPTSIEVAVPNSFFPVLSVYTGTEIDDLTLVERNYSNPLLVEFTPEEGENYLIQIGGAGSFSGALTCELPPEADDWGATEITLVGGSATVTSDNTLASTQTGEPRTFSSYGYSGTVSNTVWWSWDSDADGVAVFDTFGSDFDTTAAVFTGNSLSGLTTRAFNNDYTGGTATIEQSRISWRARPATTYYIQVGGDGSATGNITGHLTFSPYATGGSADPAWNSGTASAYRIELRELNSAGFEVTTSDLNLVTFSCNWRLNGPGAFEGTGVVGVTQADAANVGARELIVYKGSTAIWGGYLNFFDVDEDTKQIRVAAEGYWGRARSRLMRGNQIYKPVTNSGVAWDAHVIAWDIIDQAQGATYGDMGWVYGGHSGDSLECKRVYYGVDRTNVGEAIEALAREGFFDFSVDVRATPTEGNVAQFRTWHERGTDRSGSINLSASNAMTLNYSLASSDMATVIDVFGSVEGCRGVAATEEENLATYGRLEARPIDMETDEQAEVDETAARFIDQHSVPAKTATVTYLEGVGPALSAYDLGDTIRVSPADGYVSNFDGRVVSRELAVEANRAVITVEVER